jgi:hypothetical protein
MVCFPGFAIAQSIPAAQAVESGGKEIMNRTITKITAGAGIALAGILIPALGASASTQSAPVQNYSWATGFDSGTSAPASITENFLITSQSLKDRTGAAENNHSLTETYVRDKAGNAFEFGVTSDTFNPTLQPTLFTTAWTAGAFDGYQAGFVSTSSVKPGLFQPPVGTSPQFGYSVSKGTVTFTYAGKAIGYIPASHWPGGFGSGGSSQTYGEVWNNTPGGTVYPSMNGRVTNYKTSTGSHLAKYGVSSPYRLTSAGATSFTFGS